MARIRQRKQVGGTRVDAKFKNRQFYCRLIKAGASRKEVNEHYKKKEGKELASSTYHDWVKKADEILAAEKITNRCRQNYKLSEIREQFDKDLLAVLSKIKKKSSPDNR